MAHSDKQQPAFSNNPDSQNRQKSQALSRDIEDLNNGLRIDFDQKLSELAELLGRFKALVIAPSTTAANDESKTDTAAAQYLTDEKAPATITPLFSNTQLPAESDSSDESVATDSADSADSNSVDAIPVDTPVAPISIPSTPSTVAAEPARFETGLYKLNSQLYRFRLELDQELEYREEPLHIHFRQESELSLIFQKLNDKSSEKNPDN